MKKVMEKLWNKKNSKKGFTLVELIVVLVILAILAAIMVPALIGWIDKAKEKQAAINARTVYLAAQTISSEKYAKVTDTNSYKDLMGLDDNGKLEVTNTSSTDAAGEIKELAAVTETYTATITFEKGKVTGMLYEQEDGSGPVTIGEVEDSTGD